MKNILKAIIFLIGSVALAQSSTNYEEIPLDTIPITVANRTSNSPVAQIGLAENQENFVSSSMVNGAGGSAISETNGELSVSLTGGATYTLPIKVPPGINGVVPTIAINYNSQGGNGLAGYGWNVSGISVISRIPSTKFHDSNIDPVDFDNLDRFALDGQRLILKSGTYGGSGSVYETENFSNLKIVSNGVSGYGTAYGPLSFTVTYPDGSIATYGNSSDSRSRTDFAITNWKNPQGVIVEYVYTTADNSLSISSIRYGHRTGFTAVNTINFVYKPRKRAEQSFIGGQDFKRKTILSEIKVLAGTSGYRNYVLAHVFNTLGYEKLTSVTEKSGDNTLSFSPVTFNYPAESGSSLVATTINTTLNVSNLEQRNATMVPLEINGDGKMDFIIYPKTKSERTKLWLFKDIQSGSNNIGNTIEPLSIYEDVFPMSYLNASNQLSKTQGFTLLTHTSSNEVRFKVMGVGSLGAISQVYEKLWMAPSYQARNTCTVAPYTYRAPLKYISGDFNGDGLTDVVAINSPYSYTNCVERVPTASNPCSGGGGPQPIIIQGASNLQQPTSQPMAAATGTTCCECSSSSQASSLVYFINLDRRIATSFTSITGNLVVSLKTADQLISADVNGDGKSDILHITAGKIYAYSLSASNSLNLLWTTTDTRIKTEYQPMLGDFNGDGKTDVMYPTATNSTTFALFRSTGIQFIKNEAVYPFTYRLSQTATSPVTTYNLVPTDINGDGRTDMLEYKTTTNNNGLNGSQVLSTYNNTFSATTDVFPTFVSITHNPINSDLNHFPIPVFLTSVNKSNDNLDFATISNNRVFSYTFGKDNRKDMLLSGINNNGVVQNITYRDLDPSPSLTGLDGIRVYEDKITQVYPYVDIGNALGTKVVVGIDRVVSGTTAIRQVFSYEGAVFHMDGLGFMGFQGLARSQWNTGNTDRFWDITKHDILNRGAVISAYTIPYTVNFTSIPSDYVTKTSFINASSLSASKVFKINNTSNVVQNRLEGTSISTSYLYDITYNNPTKITVDYSGQGSSVTDITYANSTGATYYIGRPLTKKQTTTINGNPFTSEEAYTYNGYLLWKIDTMGNGVATADNQTFLYDAFGNITKKSTTPYGMSTREVNFTYDTSGRYLLTSKDVENLTTTFEYNASAGTLKKEIDPYGLSTQYLYDGWNRLTKVTDYLNKNANTTYVETANAYTVTVSADDGGSAIIGYDPLQRMVKESQKDVLGQWVSKSYQYDKFDRIWKESEPYIGTAATQWNTTEYDLYGRPKTLTSCTGKVTSMTYTNQSVSVNDGTKTVTTTKDAMGNVTQVTDPGGTITYTYFGNGAMKTSTFSGITLAMEQDAWGRKTKLIDPSAGTYSYEYNRYGEMTKEITPKGNTVYEYTTLGKLNKKTVTGDATTNMVINYTYDATTKLPKTIALATNNDGNTGTTTINYDSYQRVTSTVESSTYTTFTKTFAYDAFGRVDTEESKAQLGTKSSTAKVKNTYAYGQLKNVNDFSTSEELWNITGLNAKGQVTTATMGVGMKRTNTYDANGYLTQALSQKNVTTSAVELMKLTFTFNTQRGILNSRTNSMFAWTENFTYDSQDRLLSYNDTNGAKNQNYDTKGRIDINSQIGQYKYSTTNFQQTELILNPTGQTYYNDYTAQNITYNSFKSPVEISENGKDRINFQYNAAMGRATMFYGDMNSDKLIRPFRKHYSQDGSMEIKWEKATGKATFATYIGGDGYSSSVMYHSEQGSSTVSQYLYLHRDYLGSILAITDKNGNFKEKRHFDAWGNIIKLTDGNNVALTKFAVLDRGYTGHEHLQGVGLVHMNGRLYDPMLHRFLMPDNFVQDPFNSMSYNRYAYVMNNPLMYVDYNGEFLVETGTLLWIGGSLAASALLTWGEQIKSAQYMRWFEGAVGKPVENWVNKHVVNPVRSLFGGGAKAPPKTVHMLSVPGTPLANGPTNLPIFNASNGGGLGISTAQSGNQISFTEGAPKQDFSGFWGGVNFFLNGGITDGYRYDYDGNAVGVAPAMGIAPTPGIGNLGNALKGGTTVLGKFPEYLQLGKKLNARTFSIPSNIWNGMTSAQQWAANLKFLNRTIARGDKIILSNPVKNINNISGYLRRELDYLLSQGYKLSKDGKELIK